MVQIGGTVLSSTARVQRVVLLLLAVSLLVPAVPAVAQTSSEVAAGDADYVFTFAEDTVGEQPAYLSLPWQQTAVSVVDSGWALDGKALQIDPYDTNAFFAAVFDEVPAATNVEVLLRFRDTGTLSDVHWLTGAGARIAGGPGTETAVLSQSRDGTEGLVLARLNDGEFAGGFTEFTATQGTYLRTRWQDDVVSAKLWDGTLADEPEAWSVTGHTLDDPTLDPGKVGITRYFSQHTTQIDYLTIDLLTEPEPEPPATVRIMPVGDSITSGSTNAPGPQPTYRMFLYDHLVASGLAPGSGFDLVGPYNTHPSSTYDYLRQDDWDHDSLSVSAWQTSDARDAVADAVTTYDPDVLLVLVGVNDLRFEGLSPEAAAANIDALIDNARAARSDVEIVLAEIPPTAAQFDTAIEEYNSRLRALASSTSTGTSPVVTADLYTGYDIDVHHYDDLHPNAEGDELIASRFADVLHQEFSIGDPWDGDTDPEPVVPVVMITEGPTGTVASAGATFAFTADVDGATFECRVVEVAGWATCTSPFEVTGLTDGSYTFEVRASVDGRTGEPDSRTWTVALPAPDPDPEPQPDPAPTPTIPAGAVPLTGDWNGDGTSTPGWFVAGRWYLVPELSTGEVVSFFYGRATDLPVVGDWDGDGTDTVGVRRANQWLLRTTNTAGNANLAFAYGRASDVPVVGDWDGNGTDTVGVRRANQWLLRTTNTAGNANLAFAYGRTTDLPVVGDWDGNGTDTVGVRRANQWLLRTTNTAGNANLAFAYGRTTDLPVVGDWDGNGTDTIGIYRNGTWYLRTTNTTGNANLTY
jgi:lysophospholipase L1-like esterase